MIRETVFCNLAVEAVFYFSSRSAERNERRWQKTSVTAARQLTSVGLGSELHPSMSRQVWVREQERCEVWLTGGMAGEVMCKLPKDHSGPHAP